MSKNFQIETSTDGAEHALSDSNQLCIDVIAQNWAKEAPNRAPSDFYDAVEEQLHLAGKKPNEVDRQYMQAVEAKEIERHGEEAGRKLLADAISKWSCE